MKRQSKCYSIRQLYIKKQMKELCNQEEKFCQDEVLRGKKKKERKSKRSRGGKNSKGSDG